MRCSKIECCLLGCLLFIGSSIPLLSETYTVTNTNDSGAGSLRQALSEAASHAGPDTVVFNIPAGATGHNADSGTWTIQPASGYELGDATFLDGASQAAFIGGDPNPLGPEIVLDGSVVGTATGLNIMGDDCRIVELVIHSFEYDQIRIHADGNTIAGCYIGTGSSGTERFAQSRSGISLFSAHHNTIGGEDEADRNIISGCVYNGMRLSESNYNEILGNYIGLNATGTDTLSNSIGIYMSQSNRCTIGPSNVVSGNQDNGFEIIAGSDSNAVTGNCIGTDPEGVLSFGNGYNGIRLAGGSAYNRIGGTAETERNCISGNESSGISITGSSTEYNRVTGNHVGTDITGMIPMGNGASGVLIGSGAKYNTIGGEGEGEGNLISDNGYHGVLLNSLDTEYNEIIGNRIGTDATGTGAMGNDHDGVNINYGPTHNTVGPGNIIAFNEHEGVAVEFEGTTGNTITRNSIFSNAGMGILLLSGGNNDLSAPTISSLGPLTGTADPNTVIEVFTGPDAEGKIYEGFTTADAGGNYTWTGGLTGTFVTTTATDGSGNTSEFSEAWRTGGIVVTTTADTGIGSLRQALTDADLTSGPDTIFFNIPETDDHFDGTVWTIRPQSVFPAQYDGGTVILGYSQDDYAGDRNPDGPDILIDGSEVEGSYRSGLILYSSGNVIAGLTISGFSASGIRISGSNAHNNLIWGNFIGTNATGDDTLGNQQGISIQSDARHNIIGGSLPQERNVISGNKIGLYLSNSDSNLVIGNFIGTDRSGTAPVPNSMDGMHMDYQCKHNTIGGLSENEGNIISCNGYGIYAYDQVDSNLIQGNFIGTDRTGVLDLGNDELGIYFTKSTGNQIGPGNFIRHNGGEGVSFSNASSMYNRITENSISNNEGPGILLWNGSNRGIQSPVITSIGSVEGTAPPNTMIEIFSDPEDEGLVYEGTVQADGSGSFSWPGDPEGPYVTATATDDSGNTSAFSIPKRIGDIVVTTTEDSVIGSLRWAIELANTDAGSDTILFNIPVEDGGYRDGVWTIRPESQLPALTDSCTVIDGSTQTDNQGDTNPDGKEIVIDGSALPSYPHGLFIQSSYNVIADLVVSGFGGTGIMIYSSKAHHNHLRGNFIGTDASGTDTLRNNNGVEISWNADCNIIGGLIPEHRNIVSGNRGRGVMISDSDSNLVVGNYIGTDITGQSALPNKSYGVSVNNASCWNRIGGGEEAERNVISGNLSAGIMLSGSGTTDNEVLGNYIGTDAGGTVPLENDYAGIFIAYGASYNTVGGSTDGDANVISCNTGNGIDIYGTDTDSNRVVGNFIGTDRTGTEDLGNQQSGVLIGEGSQWNQIGPGNVIRYNRSRGVYIYSSKTRYNTITQNSISDNAYDGIYLGHGANSDLASPVLTGVGSVTGTAAPFSTVEIFSDSSDEGSIYEGVTSADAGGDFYWSGSPVGPFVTATATDDSGNTSAFSQPRLAGSIIVTTTADSGWGSIRWAIEMANSSQGGDTVQFNIPVADDGFNGTVYHPFRLNCNLTKAVMTWNI